MKTLFIHAKSKSDIKPVLKKVKIEGKIGLASSIQYLHKLEEAQKIIKNSIIAGQVIGCDASSCIKIKDKVDSFLFIGTGRFHPIEIAIKTKKPVYIADPISNKFDKIEEKEIKELENKLKGKLAKFYNAKKIGIIISEKPGQFHPKQYLNLKNKLALAKSIKEKINKETFIFISETLDEKQLENFPDIDIWINTACPRIEFKNIISLQDLKL